MSNGPIIQIAAFTHQGRIRDTNEDSIAMGPWVRNRPMSTPHLWRLALEEPLVCVVADGMGGQAAGEVASQHVAARLSQEATQATDVETLGTLLQKINGELYDFMAEDSSRIGMGSTVVGVIIRENRMIWFNVGDSRLYQHRNGFLRQISVDDVPDVLKTQDSNSRSRTGAITQSLGGTKSIQRPSPHAGEIETPVPSRWLLCSDGLTDMVDLDAMEACMNETDLVAVSKLVDAAIQAGGKDNISTIILSVIAPEPGTVLGPALV